MWISGACRGGIFALFFNDFCFSFIADCERLNELIDPVRSLRYQPLRVPISGPYLFSYAILYDLTNDFVNNILKIVYWPRSVVLRQKNWSSGIAALSALTWWLPFRPDARASCSVLNVLPIPSPSISRTFLWTVTNSYGSGTRGSTLLYNMVTILSMSEKRAHGCVLLRTNEPNSNVLNVCTLFWNCPY